MFDLSIHFITYVYLKCNFLINLHVCHNFDAILLFLQYDMCSVCSDMVSVVY